MPTREPSPTAAAHIALAERYAAALARQNGRRYGVDQSGRDYLRVYVVDGANDAPGNGSRSIVCFVGRGSGIVYRGDSWRKRGRRLGMIEAFVAAFRQPSAVAS